MLAAVELSVRSSCQRPSQHHTWKFSMTSKTSSKLLPGNSAPQRPSVSTSSLRAIEVPSLQAHQHSYWLMPLSALTHRLQWGVARPKSWLGHPCPRLHKRLHCSRIVSVPCSMPHALLTIVLISTTMSIATALLMLAGDSKRVTNAAPTHWLRAVRYR